jgi:hypothetical protein
MDMPVPVRASQAVTRVEVVDHIHDVFASGPVTRADLVAEAGRNGARTAVIDLLGRLPDRRFTRPHELWDNLRDVPID